MYDFFEIEQLDIDSEITKFIETITDVNLLNNENSQDKYQAICNQFINSKGI